MSLCCGYVVHLPGSTGLNDCNILQSTLRLNVHCGSLRIITEIVQCVQRIKGILIHVNPKTAPQMLATHVSNTYYIYHITSHIIFFAIGDVFCRPPRVSASAPSNLHLARCGPVSDLVVNLRLGRIQRQLKNNINNGSLRLKLRFCCRSDRSFGIHIWRLPHAPRIGDWTESMREAGEVESSLVVMRPLHIASCHVS